MAASVFLCYFIWLLVLGGEVVSGNELVMQEEELLGLFEVLGSLLDDPDWPEMHPQPCTETPWPGVQCEIADDDSFVFHVTKIHIGPEIVNPPCKTSAHLSISLLKLPYLKVLSIFNCFVTLPATLAPTFFDTLSSLEHLALDSNPNLSGNIPSSLGKITSLRVLSLSQNNLQGNIPDELGGLVNLEQLDLSYNNLSGEIPEKIGELKSLSILDLSWNSLQGQVPSSSGQLQVLQKLDLGYNKLQGNIPSEMGKLRRLVLLDLSHNFINGPIPKTFSGLEQLQYLVLNHNPINSGIPLILGYMKCLKTLSLSRCGLTGPIPNSLSLLKNLTALSLDNNTLMGRVPSGLGSLPNLDQLNVSNNELSGELFLPEKFIDKLGKRLDVRGNSGLCIRKKIYRKKNISEYLETPDCLDKIGKTGCPNQDKCIQASWYHGNISSSGIISESCPNQDLLVLYVLLLLYFLYY